MGELGVVEEAASMVVAEVGRTRPELALSHAGRLGLADVDVHQQSKR